MVTRLLVGSCPFPMTLFPLIRLSGHSRKQSASALSASAGWADPRSARDHSAAAGRSVLCGSPALAETNFATAHRCASSAIDSPVRRFCDLADSSSPGHSPNTLPNPQLRECRIRRSNTRQLIGIATVRSRIASANSPSPSARRWCTRSVVPLAVPARRYGGVNALGVVSHL
jgi:hypothetical protein